MLSLNKRTKAIKEVEASVAQVLNAKQIVLEFGQKNHILILILLCTLPIRTSQKLATMIPIGSDINPEQEM